MLSICIPHYNFVNPLLFEHLFYQCKNCGINFEIIIADDASENSNKAYLKQFTQPEYKLFFLEKNIGRSAIRNYLATKANYGHLLFLDADAEIISDDFISIYISQLGNNIISGGRVYSINEPAHEYSLHYTYGSQVEQYSGALFQSNNFIIPKIVFSSLIFDERLTDYGYEDVLFGLNAKRLGVKLQRVNNPVKHIHLKTNREFVNDLEKALQNLTMLIQTEKDLQLRQEVSVSAFHRKLKKHRLTFLLSIKQQFILRIIKKSMFLNLPIGKTFLISVYKLFYFHHLQKN